MLHRHLELLKGAETARFWNKTMTCQIIESACFYSISSPNRVFLYLSQRFEKIRVAPLQGDCARFI